MKYDPLASFCKEIIGNGLTVYHHNGFGDRDRVWMEIVVHTGERSEPVQQEHIARLVQVLLFKNFPGKTTKEIGHFLKEHNTEVRPSCTYNSSHFAVRTTRRALPKILEFLGIALFHTKLSTGVQDTYHDLISKDGGRSFEQMELLRHRAEMDQRIFKGHRLERTTLSAPAYDRILAMSIEDIQRFHETHYVPANVSIVVAGDIGRVELIDKISASTLGVTKEGSRNPLPHPFTAFTPPQERVIERSISESADCTSGRVHSAVAWPIKSDNNLAQCVVVSHMLHKMIWREGGQQKEGGHALCFAQLNSCYQDFGDLGLFALTLRAEAPFTSQNYTERLLAFLDKIVSALTDEEKLLEQIRGTLLESLQNSDFSAEQCVSEASRGLSDLQRIWTLQEEETQLTQLCMGDVTQIAAFLTAERRHVLVVTETAD